MSERALLFQVGDEVLAVPASASREAFVPGALTPLPGGAGVLLGLTALQGGVAPLIDLATLLGLAAPRAELALLVEASGEQLAFPVQGVLGFADLEAGTAQGQELLSAPQAAGAGQARRLHLDLLVRQLRSRLTASV